MTHQRGTGVSWILKDGKVVPRKISVGSNAGMALSPEE